MQVICEERIETAKAFDAPISRESTGLLAEDLLSGAKPASEWRCGLEFEVIGYDARTLERLDAGQVRKVLLRFAASEADLIFEEGKPIEACFGNEGRITVEPGGQVEFSGAPHITLSETERGAQRFLDKLHSIAEEENFLFIAAGFDPIRSLAEQNWFPKSRYGVMRPYLAQRGRRAEDMMARTAAIQTSLDYEDECDLAKKFVLGNLLAPIATAIFANSPFEAGKLSNYKSTRAAVWLETDDDRTGCGALHFGSTIKNFSAARFVDYALQVPMIFARRNESFTSAPAGVGFGAFLDGAVSELTPVFADWRDHLSTIFTDARLKQYIELRSADGGDLQAAMAAQALWKGLMYDRGTLDEALCIAPALSAEDARTLRHEVARKGLAAHAAGVDVLHVAKQTIEIAAQGLAQIAPNEVIYLDSLREGVIEDGISPADKLLRNWRGRWQGDIRAVINYLRVA